MNPVAKVITVKTAFIFILWLAVAFFSAAQEPGNQEWNIRFDSLRSTVIEQIEALRPHYNADSVRAELENGPFFSLYKDNYFIGGIPVGSRPTAATSNVKFQLSVRQKLTRSILPFDTYLYIQFTQKTIWNMLEESLPMRDMNFNPGIGLGHLIVYRNRYIGHSYLMLEHESNGKDGEASRSWNKISFGSNLLLSKYMDVQLKTWIPIVDSQNNRDILRYSGLVQGAVSYWTGDRRFNATMLATWRSRSFSFNTQWELSFKINNNENQYLFLQYYNGYGENLLDYNRFRSVLRFGFVIKPSGFTLY